MLPRVEQTHHKFLGNASEDQSSFVNFFFFFLQVHMLMGNHFSPLTTVEPSRNFQKTFVFVACVRLSFPVCCMWRKIEKAVIQSGKCGHLWALEEKTKQQPLISIS